MASYQAVPVSLEEEDHTLSTPLKRKLCGVVIGAVFIAAISLLAGFVVIGLKSEKSGYILQFEDLFNQSFTANTPRVSWLRSPDGIDLYTITRTVNGSSCVYIVYPNNTESLILNSSRITLDGKPIAFTAFSLSYDLGYALLAYNKTAKWRYSFLASYVIYNLRDHTLQRVADGQQLLDALWSPTSNQLVYVLDNNIYLTSTNTSVPPVAVTTDGSNRKIINGVQNWLYEEELFYDYRAMWWSSDGKHLAWLRSDETEVQRFQFTTYVSVDKSPYTEQVSLPYPKSGTKNPETEVHVYNLESSNTTKLNTTLFTEQYITLVYWFSTETVVVRVLNRKQQQEVVLFNEPLDGTITHQVITQESSTWVDTNSLIFVNASYFLILKSNADYNHIALMNTAGDFVFITEGNWDVISLLKYDVDTDFVYFTSTEVSPAERHLYAVQLQNPRRVEKLTNEEGFWEAVFGSNSQYYLLKYLGPEVPKYWMRSTKYPAWNYTLEKNQQFADRLRLYNIPKKQFIVLPTNKTNVNAWMMTPPDFDNSKPSEFPLLINVYGEPGSQAVTKRFTLGFDEYLSSNLSMVVVCIDVAGTGGRGSAFAKKIYKQVGLLEAQDLINSARYLVKKTYAIDEKRVGIWGQSHGGFLTLSALTSTEGNTFRTGIAISPIVDWRLYDSAFTERYMDTPENNPEGYSETSILNKAQNLRSKLLLIHGTGDDNVHFQNSALLYEALVDAGVQYSTMVYTNNAHNIEEEASRVHLYHLVLDYLELNLVEE
eukprot:TRINITY_DN6817_c0_g1_i1.p1 TRINITY_DN6817_c0_g1~~TRINITY_DN6817_c0_g1_i1.p1  ORF type:complete len:768 (-),score=124.38 TRINITY_DN6817_c0_g1_i1:92-2395(-)